MSFAPDYLVDRRRLRRQVTRWRVIAVAIAVLAVAGIGFLLNRGSLQASAPHIARIRIEGLITGKQETIDLLKRAEASSASALILRISSGGGTTSGSEALYNEVRRVAAKKPVIAVIDGVGASGAYMTALGADRIFANGSAIVGSIGVIAQYPNFAKLLETVGVKVEAVRLSPLKAMPNGLEVTPPEARQALQDTVMESYRWFSALVGERRSLDPAQLARVTDGRVFTGRMALDLKMIDAIGGERESIAWLETEKRLRPNMPVVEYKVPEKFTGIPGLTALDGLARILGTNPPAELKEAAAVLLGPNALDGLVSVWQPPSD